MIFLVVDEAYNERDVIMAATSNSNVISQFPDTNNLSRMSAQRESDTGHQLNDTLRWVSYIRISLLTTRISLGVFLFDLK